MIGPKEFAEYIAAFNRDDIQGYSKFYDKDVLFEGRGRRLVGRDAIVEYYRVTHKRLRQTIKVNRAYFGDDGFAADLETELYFLEDWDDFFAAPMKAGETRRTLNFAFYLVRNGLVTHIRTANFSSIKIAKAQ